MGSRFDELAKSLAGGMTRREALRQFGGGLAGALLASLGLERAWGQGNGPAARWCTAHFPPGPARVDCTSRAARGGGPYYDCGPGGDNRGLCPSGTPGGVCCASGAPCCNGHCCAVGDYCVENACSACPAHSALCGESCCPTSRDCCNGTCCPEGQHCSGGTCVCADDRLPCGGQCCPEGRECSEGTCVCASDRTPCGGQCCASDESCLDEGFCCPNGWHGCPGPGVSGFICCECGCEDIGTCLPCPRN